MRFKSTSEEKRTDLGGDLVSEREYDILSQCVLVFVDFIQYSTHGGDFKLHVVRPCQARSFLLKDRHKVEHISTCM